MTAQLTTQPTTLVEIAEAAIARLEGRLLVDQGRCADVYLDLYGATEDVGLRWTIAERLDDIRYLSLVEAAEVRADLAAIIAIATSPAYAVPATQVPAPARTVVEPVSVMAAFLAA